MNGFTPENAKNKDIYPQISQKTQIIKQNFELSFVL